MTDAPAATSPSPPPIDRSSLSNPQQVVVTHLDWTARVDFDESILVGEATYDLQRLDPNAQTVCLDTCNLDIVSVTVEGTQATYVLTPGIQAHLGNCLEIHLGEKASNVTVAYKTTQASSALQWLPPSQTAGKVYPYLFTQCQAIHARSLVPCQDQPGVKMTYTAKVTVPSWATCVMSALPQDEYKDGDDQVWVWNQPVPIPSYLLAMAVGELSSVKISERCCIWSEPSVVEAAAYEFAQTEEFLETARAIAGTPYGWGRYDLLCLPPSFPYGGMENPCLTFVTPTLLAGDRSLADVVAHEIAHSWTGNLVTNATWEHFWLNEGWTMWLQRKIMARVLQNNKFLDFDAIGGWKHLQESVDLMPEQYTSLVPVLGDQDPDDAFSSIPYEKGFNLLYALEQRVGTEAFEEFFQAYIAEFAYRTITTYQFRDFFQQQFPALYFEWDEWFHKPGMPPETPNFDRTMSQEAENLAKVWLAVDRSGRMLPTTKLDGWSSNQVCCLLDALQSETQNKPLKIETLKAMNAQYGMAESQNSEILFRYCQLAVAAEDESILPVVIRFITTQGRMKFVRPLYRSLFRSKMGKELAIETFLEHKDFYHPICAKMVASDLTQEVEKEGTSSSRSKKAVFWLTTLAVLGASAGLVLFRRKR